MIEEEMRTMVDDDPELALEELKILGSFQKIGRSGCLPAKAELNHSCKKKKPSEKFS